MSDARKTSPIVTAFGVVVVLAVAGALVYAVIRGAIKNPTLIGPLATAAAAVVAVVIGRERETRLNLRQQHRDQITPIYRELVDRFRESPDEGSPEFFKKLHTGLLLDAPQEVIEAWLVWSRTFAEAPIEENTLYRPAFAATEHVLRAIRKDLGHKDADLSFGDLQRVYMLAPLGDALFGPLGRPLPLDELGERVLQLPPELE